MSGDTSKLRIKLTVTAAEYAELHAALAEIVDPRQRVGRLKMLATKGLIFERSKPTAGKRRHRESAEGNSRPLRADLPRDPGCVEVSEDLPCVEAQTCSPARDSHRHADPEPSVLAMLDWEGDGDAT